VQRVQAGTNNYAAQVHLYGNNVSGASYNSVASFVNGDSTPQWEITGAEASAEDVMILHTGGTERMRLLSSGGVDISAGNLVLDNGYGIDFSATANSSGTVTHEIFDDYEIGTWTPTIDFGGGSTSVAYAYQEGAYTKIGRHVIAHAYLDLTSKGSSSGQIRFGGLPFNVAEIMSSTSLDGAGFFTYIDSISGVYSIAIAAQDSTEKALVYGQTSSGGNFSTPITNSAIGNDFECRFTLIYVAG
jgi:hypothetical protein